MWDWNSMLPIPSWQTPDLGSYYQRLLPSPEPYVAPWDFLWPGSLISRQVHIDMDYTIVKVLGKTFRLRHKNGICWPNSNARDRVGISDQRNPNMVSSQVCWFCARDKAISSYNSTSRLFLWSARSWGLFLSVETGRGRISPSLQGDRSEFRVVTLTTWGVVENSDQNRDFAVNCAGFSTVIASILISPGAELWNFIPWESTHQYSSNDPLYKRKNQVLTWFAKDVF